MKVLVAYASLRGSTNGITERIAASKRCAVGRSLDPYPWGSWLAS